MAVPRSYSWYIADRPPSLDPANYSWAIRYRRLAPQILNPPYPVHLNFVSRLRYIHLTNFGPSSSGASGAVHLFISAE
jgi:hypothetical protein